MCELSKTQNREQIRRYTAAKVHEQRCGLASHSVIALIQKRGTMTVGTRSVLFGAHAFWLHFWFLAIAWFRLFGVPWDIRLWVAFAVHDLGYMGKNDVEGRDGETHV